MPLTKPKYHYGQFVDVPGHLAPVMIVEFFLLATKSGQLPAYHALTKLGDETIILEKDIRIAAFTTPTPAHR